MGNKFLSTLLPDVVNGKVTEEFFFTKCLLPQEIKCIAIDRIKQVKKELLNIPTEHWNDILLDYVKHIRKVRDDYKFVLLCVNRIRKTHFIDVGARTGSFYGHRVQVHIPKVGYIVEFPDDHIQIICADKRVVTEVKLIKKGEN